MGNLVTNLVKLTDYPFIYSLSGLYLLATRGHTVDLSTIGPVMVIVGVIGTALTVIDPFGQLIKFLMGILVRVTSPFELPEEKRSELEYHDEKTKYYVTRTLQTKWISYEIDKIVSTLYFLVILSSIAALAISDNLPVLGNFFNSNSTDNSVCRPPDCKTVNEFNEFKTPIIIIISLAIVGVSFAILSSVRKIRNSSSILLVYIYAVEALPERVSYINDSMPLEPAKARISDIKGWLESMKKYIENSDWAMASVYIEILIKEFEIRRVK